MGRQEELKAKNTPIDGAHYTFKLDEVDLVYAPDGWDDDEFTLQRDMIRFGVFRKFSSLELKFVKDGRDYLSAAYELGGVNTETKITVTETDTMNVTRVRFIGYIDYSTYKITELSVDVQIIDGSFTDLVLTRSKTDVDVLGIKSIDGNAITPKPAIDLLIPEIIITQSASWVGSDYTEIITNPIHNIESIISFSEFDEAKDVIDFAGIFFGPSLFDYTTVNLKYHIQGSTRAQTQTAGGFDVQITLWKKNIDNVTTIIDTEIFNSINDDVNFDLDRTANTSLAVGDTLYFQVVIFCLEEIIFDTQYNFIEYFLTSTTGTIESKTIKAFLYHEAFENIIQLYTGLPGRFKSNIFGRTDIGYTIDGELGVVTGGRFIKGAIGLNGTIPLSLTDLFDSIRAIYCAGLGIETIGGVEKAVIEPMAYFFSDAIVLDVSNRIAPETITKEYYPELSYNRISVGYNSFEYGRVGGIYEYNTTSKFTTNIKPVDKELNIVSSYRADLSGIVTLLNTDATGKDNQNENNIFIIDVLRNETGYKARTTDGFDQVDDISRRDVLLNVRLSPKRNLLRWGSYLRGFLEKYLDSLVIWQTSDKNTKLSSTETGQSTILENSDILVSDLTDPLWIPEIVQFEVPALDTDIVVIEANKYGLIKYTATDYGWILTYKAKNENGKCEFTLLRCNTDYVTPVGQSPVYPSSLNVNITITDFPDDNFAFSMLIVTDGNMFLSQLISQDNPFELTHLPYGTYEIYLYVTDTGYELTTVVPVTITISADNLHEVVDIVVYKIPTTGTVTVTKLITGVTEDETYFDITITGTDGEMVEQFDQVRLNEPLTFYDLPFGTYEITEAATDGYTLSSITPATVVLSAGNASEEVEIVNSADLGLEMSFSDITEVDGFILGDRTLVSSWNTFFDLPANGTAFSGLSIVGNIVKLYGGANITLPTDHSIFYTWFNLLQVNDYAGSIKVVSYNSFRNCENTTEIYLPGMTDVLLEGFENMHSIEKINLPACTNLGGSVGYNEVFSGISGQTITLTIPSDLMTCNGGNPDGDIQFLQANNTVTIITI